MHSVSESHTPSPGRQNPLVLRPHLFCVLLLLFSWLENHGQTPATQANVVTTFSPPYAVPLNDLTSAQLKVIITAMNGFIDQGKLAVQIYGNNGIRLQNNPATSAFNLFMADVNVYQLTDNDVQDIFDPSNFTASGITVAEAFNEGLPPGSYDICFRVFVPGRSTLVPISQEPPSGCNPFVIQDSPTAVMVTTLIQPPPYPTDLAEYSYKTQVTLQSATRRSVRLFLTIKGDNGVVIRSRGGVLTRESITLQAGVPYTLSSVDLDPYFQIKNLTFAGTSADFILNNGLPEGNYRFCIRAVNLSGAFVSAEDPLGCSNIVNIKLLEPPQLIAPACGSPFVASGAQNLVFTWTVPPGSPPGLTYTLRVVEMIDSSKNPNDAMFTATTPAFFEETISGATTFLYGPAQPLLEPGRKYAWQVIAGMGTGADFENTTRLFRNKGRSAVCWFSWNNAILPLIATAGNGKSNSPNVIQATNTDPVPVAIVSGKLNYKFKGSAKSGTAGKNTAQNFKAAPENITKDLLYNKDLTDKSQSLPLGSVKVSLVVIYVLNGKIDKKNYTNVPIQKGDLPYAGDQLDKTLKGHETVLATTTTSADGSFTLQFVHTDQLGKFQENVNWSFGGGEFFNTLSGTVYRVLRLKVENDYYCSPDLNIKVQPWEVLDLGTLVSYVKSYNLKVTVTSTTANFYEKLQAAGTGAPLDKVATNIYRKSLTANVPPNEGDKPQAGEKIKPGTHGVVGSGSTDKDGIVVFRNLVKHSFNNNIDRYYISCSTSKDEGVHNYKTKEVRYRPFSVNEKQQFPFNSIISEKIKPAGGIAYDVYYGSSVVWNSEFVVDTYEKVIQLTPELPRIAGKVYSVFAGDKPMGGRKILLLSKYAKSNDTNQPVRTTLSDYNTGQYQFNSLDVEISTHWDAADPTNKKFLNKVDGPARTLICKVPGYKLFLQELGTLKYGTQLASQDIPLEPDGWLAGNVVDEDGNAVKASVYVDSIRNETKSIFQYNTGNSQTSKKPNMALAPSKMIEQFEMKAPSGKAKTILIIPHDKAYYKETYVIDIPLKSAETQKEIKSYTVYRARKRITFRVLAGKTSTGKLQLPSTAKPLANVGVTLDFPNQELTEVSNSDGYVTFQFENNSEGPFDFIVEPPDDADFESTVYTLNDVKSSKEVTEYPAIYLKPATFIEGVVTIKGKNTAVENARVYINLGNGNKLETTTDAQGKYRLNKVPKSPQEKTVVAAKPDVVPNLISQSKTILLNDQGTNVADFELEEDLEMVVSDIFGFKVIIEEMKKEPDGTRTIVKGSLIDIPGNENFKLYNEKASLPFSNIKIKKSGAVDPAGIPIGIPELNSIALDLLELKLSANTVFGAVHKTNTNAQLKVESIDGVGYLAGNVSLLQNSFTFSDQYLVVPDGKTYYLAGELDGGQKELMTLTAGAYPKRKFFITDDQGKNFQFRYLGFKAEADRNQSFLDGDKIVLQTTLSTEKIPGMTPSQIDLKIGSLIIKTSKIEPVSGDKPITFKLENWEVVCPKWTIHQNGSGILIPGGTVKTGLIDLPANSMTILPNQFEASGFDVKNITLSGVAPLLITNSEKALFGYNSSTGKDKKGHWELRVFGEDGKPGATLANLPGMESGETIDISVLSLISNGEQNVSFSPQYQGTTFYKVLKTKPIAFSGGEGYFQMYCNLDLNIPNVPKSNGILQFSREGSGIALKMFPISVDVEGPGFVQFYSGAKQGDQQLKPGEFTAVGDIRDKEGIALKGKLHRTVEKIWIDVDPDGQVLPLGQGNTSLAGIDGTMAVQSNGTWSNFTFSGDMKGFKGIQGDLRKTFTVYGTIKADQESIDVKNIPTPFGGMELTYDIKNARMTGNLQIKKNIGMLSMNGLANVVVDGSGWYFVSGGAISTPGLGDLSAGMLIGDYNFMPADVSQKIMQFAYDKTVPASFKTGISGFFFTGEKELPVINVPDFSVDLGVLSASMGAEAGLDGRLWMDFDDSGNTYGIGAMAFAHVYFKAASITCTKLGAEARAELGAKGVYTTSNGTFSVKGCGSITVTGSAEQCFPTPCWSDGICCTGCIGDSISKGLRIDILLDSQGNTDLSFDFGNCSGQPTMSSNW